MYNINCFPLAVVERIVKGNEMQQSYSCIGFILSATAWCMKIPGFWSDEKATAHIYSSKPSIFHAINENGEYLYLGTSTIAAWKLLHIVR